MPDGLLDLGMGVVVGGLAMSACWGLFWLAVGTMGLVRRTCRWLVVFNSLAVSAVPLMLLSGLVWLRGPAYATSPAFAIGLCVMPLVLVGLGLRQAPDGQRAATHMLGGVRHLRDELLGKHQTCGGCSHEHEEGSCS
ncbi:MAG TPA: hypothetical protein VKP13_00310 [Nitrospira sp.]|nr:hypothetical protein [Nitrospira sp.]